MSLISIIDQIHLLLNKIYYETREICRMFMYMYLVLYIFDSFVGENIESSTEC
jgi:hypothetical protein